MEAELARLSQLPGEAGRLARAYLEQLRQDRFYESRLRRMRRSSAVFLSGPAARQLMAVAARRGASQRHAGAA